MMHDRVVLAYSGGLDTSVIAKWLIEEHNLEVITFTADIGQGEEVKDAKRIAKKYGVNVFFYRSQKLKCIYSKNKCKKQDTFL